MLERTRQALLAINAEFYRAHAQAFDASRGHHPWPGWTRLLEWLPESQVEGTDRPLSVLDVGCGNARLAPFLAESGFRLRYVGVDADAALLDAARTRLPSDLGDQVELIETDFLTAPAPGRHLPDGPFDFVGLFGVLHHVPSRTWRSQLVAELGARLRPGGLLALAAWQFANRPRFDRHRVDWSSLPAFAGGELDPADLEDGDHLLSFGAEPGRPPRYCHQVEDAELDSLEKDASAAGLALEPVADFFADGGEGNLNHYRVCRRK